VPLFYFALKAGLQTIPDAEGQELVDEAAAQLHAIAVAGELMRHRESVSHSWRIQVCDDYLEPLFEVFFGEIDETSSSRAVAPEGLDRGCGTNGRGAR